MSIDPDHLSSQVTSSLGVTRRHARFATRLECQNVFGYTPGSVPPLALKPKTITTIIDVCLLSSSYLELLCGGGSPSRVFICTFEELTKLCPGAAVIPISQEAREGDDVGLSEGKKEEEDGDIGRMLWTPPPEGVSGNEIKFLIDSMLTR